MIEVDGSTLYVINAESKVSSYTETQSVDAATISAPTKVIVCIGNGFGVAKMVIRNIFRL